MKFIIGLAISFVVGVSCRFFDLPVGSPSALPGALLVLAMTAGYSWTNRLLVVWEGPTDAAHLHSVLEVRPSVPSIPGRSLPDGENSLGARARLETL